MHLVRISNYRIRDIISRGLFLFYPIFTLAAAYIADYLCTKNENSSFFKLKIPHWTYLLQILSKLCFQRVAFSVNYEIVAISTDKTTILNDLDYKADIGQHFHKSEKSARWRHRHKIIKTNLKTHISPLLTRPQGSKGCQKMCQDPLNILVEVWCAKIAPKLKNVWKKSKKTGFF